MARAVAGRRLLTAALLGAILSGLGGGAAYSVATASVAHTGSIPSVGSTSLTSGGGPGGAGRGAPGGSTGSAPAGMTGARPSGSAPTGTLPSGTRGSTASTGTSAGGATSSAALTALLKSAGTEWSAAVDGSQTAATLELASGTAVMAIGGWSSDPTPTLAQFEAYVKAGAIHYYVVSGSGGGQGGAQGGSTSSAILAWVKAHCSSTTVGGTTVYDLTTAKA